MSIGGRGGPLASGAPARPCSAGEGARCRGARTHTHHVQKARPREPMSQQHRAREQLQRVLTCRVLPELLGCPELGGVTPRRNWLLCKVLNAEKGFC